jgi:hypothetical protein
LQNGLASPFDNNPRSLSPVQDAIMPPLKPIVFALVSTLAASGASFADAKDPDAITRIWTGFRDAQSFVRLSEYFDGKENPGNTVVLRTSPDSREGFYFTIRLNGTANRPLVPGKLRLDVIAPDAEKPVTYEFDFTPANRKSSLVELGVTGPDWPAGKTLPLAWRIEILDGNGDVTAARNSFLWENP